MRRYTRLSNGFSRKVENHMAAVALNYFVYNFCKIHSTLRTAPAMAAGVVWWAQGRQSAASGSAEAPVAESASGLSAAMRAMPGLGASPNPWATAPSAPPTSPLDHVAAPVFKANARGGLLVGHGLLRDLTTRSGRRLPGTRGRPAVEVRSRQAATAWLVNFL